MNLRELANSATATINPNEPVTVKRSTGYTIGDGRKQVPTYADPVAGFAQVQALDSDALKHMDGLNIQGTLRTIYLTGNLAGVIRPDQKGGDIVIRTNEGSAKTWLIVKVLETWPDWTKAVIVLQGE